VVFLVYEPGSKKINISLNAPLLCDLIIVKDIWIGEYHAPNAHPGETKEKIKPTPTRISGQVRTEPILVFIEKYHIARNSWSGTQTR